MNKALSTLISGWVLSAALSTPAMALTVEGVDVPDTYTAQQSELTLNGAGTRSKWFMDLYVGGLYTPQKASDAAAVINADEPQAITLHIISGLITSEKMTSATLEGFESATGGNLAPIQSDVNAFLDVFSEEIKEGDVFDLVYLPGEGVRVLKNGDARATVGGLEFKKALFGIWLSDEPAQEDLKQKMLGQR
ncbi:MULTISPECIES: chalcone isomerase family protein [Marinobacter]|uniref:chalcone isomerase family protein n=1 Tax=Marinobacter TaxID=2742 RepID=UPI001D0615A7|nr:MULTISPECIES: chalcone isomerase family protein [Marinobacter]MCG8517011.1 chalcone isomerase family protein [Pseudomonadales bacterium]MCK7566803.1 chalcone isomerase family protein [Marinobacter xestospongiae]UDL03673.1 chalcone isomerase family protein [Marinobacter sp. CA1]